MCDRSYRPYTMLENSRFLQLITDNSSSPAGQSQLCAVSDWEHNGTNSAVNCDDDVQHTSTVHPALYFFVVAQLLVGFGGCGLSVLTAPYIDENAPQTKSSFYLGISTSFVTSITLSTSRVASCFAPRFFMFHITFVILPTANSVTLCILSPCCL